MKFSQVQRFSVLNKHEEPKNYKTNKKIMKSLALVFILLVTGIFENITKIVTTLEENNKHSECIFPATINQSSTISKKPAVLSRTVSQSTTVVAPTLSVKPVSLTGFTTTANQPSAIKSYNLIAANLVNGINATATARQATK